MNYAVWILEKESRFLAVSGALSVVLTIGMLAYFAANGLWIGIVGAALVVQLGLLAGIAFSKIAWEAFWKHLVAESRKLNDENSV